MRMSMCACVVRVAGREQLHVRVCMCDATWPVRLGACECGRADVEVWLWACASPLTWIRTRLLRSLGGGGGHTCGPRMWLSLARVVPRQKAVLLPVPIPLPHAVPKGQALPRTKPCSCPV